MGPILLSAVLAASKAMRQQVPRSVWRGVAVFGALPLGKVGLER